MNLTDFRKTPLPRVQELIRREAARFGVAIHHSELVGLIPEEALIDTAAWYLQLDQFEAQQVLERRLEGVHSECLEGNALPDSGFLDALAAGTAAPGGGSASAYAAAMAASLVAMVARLTIGKKKYANVEDEMQGVLTRAETLRAELASAVQEDAQAYQAVMSAYQLPKDAPAEAGARAAAIEAATLKASEVPLGVAGKAVEVLELASQVVAHGNLNAISDGGSAAALGLAALAAAGHNVRINVASLKDEVTGRRLLEHLRRLDDDAARLEQAINATLNDRGGLSRA
jgi:glutamate formiminotransferase/formiminotetrahydrofolate cyclodeaminase